MRLKAVSLSPTTECSHLAFQPFSPAVPSSLLTPPPRSRKYEVDGPTSPVVLSNPFASKAHLKSHSFNKIWRGHGGVRRSCSANLDSPKWSEEEGHRKKKKKLHCATSKDSPFIIDNNKRGRDQDSFLNSRFDFLEPMMLGIKPEFPDWPDQETVMWATIEQKANSLDIPLSLRMIKKKLQWEEGLAESKESAYCSVKAAFASMVFIIVELQSCALHLRETLCDEDLEIINSKVQKEMHSSFVWLFQQVFSRTPSLMLHVMMLLANFGVHSTSLNVELEETSLSRALVEHTSDVLSSEEKQVLQNLQISSSLSTLFIGNDNEEVKQTGNLPHNLESVAEMNLWNSMVDDATKMREVKDDKVLDHESAQYFVAPVSVELEPDGYEDYQRTDLLYQMNLSQEPNNALLLCNYAQFLHLVARDYDRAEECFKRAVQVLLPDAESLTQYAIFLWTIRKDYTGAEESFLKGLAIEPDNSYFASRYANFLWSTGGEETCFPLNNPNL